MDAENQKAESGREHQRRAALFNAAEQKVTLLHNFYSRLHLSYLFVGATTRRSFTASCY